MSLSESPDVLAWTCPTHGAIRCECWHRAINAEIGRLRAQEPSLAARPVTDPTMVSIRLSVTDWEAGELTALAAMRTIRAALEIADRAKADVVSHPGCQCANHEMWPDPDCPKEGGPSDA